MMPNSSAPYHFLPWVRWGAAKDIKGKIGKKIEPESPQTSIPSHAQMPTKLHLIGEKESGEQAVYELEIPLKLYGPGDVRGIDAREIVRVEPRNLTTDFPPHLFPFIEFDRPDFPWLFTPAAPDDDQCLRPWIALVVVQKKKATITSSRPLPILHCPVTELPDLEESWAWAHAQYVGSVADGGSIEQALSDRPDQNVSRLLCARKLEPRQGYYACLVPAFEVGRKAGLGERIQTAEEVISPAWDITLINQEVALPVYYHWEFSTAEEGSFEELIRRMIKSPESLPTAVPRCMDMSNPFADMIITGMPELPKYRDATLDIASALSMDNFDPAGQFPHSEFQKILLKILRSGLKISTETGSITPSIPLPVYGVWHADGVLPAQALDDLSGSSQKPPPWIKELNLDPRYRAAAALGTQIVQREQEALMQAAWEDLAEKRRVNQLLVQMQLGRAVTASIYEKRLKKISPAAFLRYTAATPQVRKVEALSSEENTIVAAMVSAPFRRIVRPFSSMMRKLSATEGGASRSIESREGESAPEEGEVLLSVIPPPGATAGAITISAYPSKAVARPLALTDEKLAENQNNTLKELKPQVTFKLKAKRVIRGLQAMNKAGNHRDPLQTLTFTPSFPRPMYEALRDQFPDSLIPGLDQIPNKSIFALKPNRAFIEAFMVGLNHEMSREFLWREYPTELGGTYFQQFWGVKTDQSSDDIPPMKNWTASLGKNMEASMVGNLTMLVIRGDFLIRYPNALIYAVPAELNQKGVAKPKSNGFPKFSQFRMEPAPGITLLGFDLPEQEAGWFFVFEEHPTETRFGLDNKVTDDPPNSWHNVAWNHVMLRGGTGYLDLNSELNLNDNRAVWKRNGAHMAYITLRSTFRLLIHQSYWFKGRDTGTTNR